MPVIIISAKNKLNDKMQGIDIGADYYITKPFEPEEVLMTVKSILRRCYQYQEKDRIIKIGDLELDEDTFILRNNGQKVDLTNIELKILIKMVELYIHFIEIL